MSGRDCSATEARIRRGTLRPGRRGLRAGAPGGSSTAEVDPQALRDWPTTDGSSSTREQPRAPSRRARCHRPAHAGRAARSPRTRASCCVATTLAGMLRDDRRRRARSSDAVGRSCAPTSARCTRRIEDYITPLLRRDTQTERNAVGFVMTVYRRRLTPAASPRCAEPGTAAGVRTGRPAGARAIVLGRRKTYPTTKRRTTAIDVDEDDVDLDVGEAARARRSRDRYPRRCSSTCEGCLRTPKAPHDWLRAPARGAARGPSASAQVDRVHAVHRHARLPARRARCVDGRQVVCFSGRGGERVAKRAAGEPCTTRRGEAGLPATGRATILLCTDARCARGSTSSSAVALVNYDMPWNPMRVDHKTTARFIRREDSR